MNTKLDLLQRLELKSLIKLAALGAGLGFILLIIFMLTPDDLQYGFWVVIPMVTVSAGGAFGGVGYYLVVDLLNPTGWKKVMAITFSLLVYLLSLWLSLVAALNFTGHWS